MVNACYAQLTAQLAGTIMDPSGAVIPEASVILTSESTGFRWEVKTNAAGIYNIPFLQPGAYRIDVQAQRFRPVSRSGVRLEVAQTARVDFTLEVGATADSISVVDKAPLLNAGTAATGGVIAPESVENLPMLGRNSNALMVLAPGVRATRQTTVNPALESHYQFFSINGSRPNQSQFTLDGGNNTNLTFNGPEYSPQVEEVEEFRIQTSNFSAEYGKSGGGVINVVSKGGTNEFHGSLFDYFRNDKLAANDFFANRSGTPRTILRYNQFGGTVGGPIRKNHTFFFFSYEGLRMKTPTVRTTTVPTTLQRAADFSRTTTAEGQLITIYDPLSTRVDPRNAAQYIRTPFVGNKIPVNMIDLVAAKIQTYYPAATSAGDPGTGLNNFFFSGPSIRTTDTFSGRVDQQLSSSTMLTARFSRANLSKWTAPATFGEKNIASPGYATKPQHHPYALGKVTRAFSPTLFGEFLFSWARWYYESLGLSNGFDPTQLGFPSYLAAHSASLGFPSVNPGQASSLGTYYNELDVSDRLEWKANLSKVSGKHTFKFGGIYGLGRYTTVASDNGTGTYSFTKAFTQGPNPLVASPSAGFGYASFLLGTMSGGSHPAIGWHGAYTAPYYGLYFQEDFKVTARLTLNLGIRWDLEAPRTEKQNMVANFDYTGKATLPNGTPVTGGLAFPGVGGLPAGNWNPNKRDFAPRFGFAYNIKNATVIRGGYGIFYSNTWGNGRNNQALPQSGFTCSTSIITSLDNGLTPYARLSDPFPSGFCKVTGSSAGLLTNLGQGLNMLDRNQLTPYVQTWNFSIQRRLPGDTVVEAAYSGSHGIHLMGILENNQLAPQYMSLGTQLNRQAPNPYYGFVTSGQLSASTTTLGQSLRPYPQFLGVSSRGATYGNSSYNAMWVKVERRMAKGFSFTAAYTVAKELDDVIASVNGFPGESFSGGGIQNFYNLRGERALSRPGTHRKPWCCRLRLRTPVRSRQAVPDPGRSDRQIRGRMAGPMGSRCSRAALRCRSAEGMRTALWPAPSARTGAAQDANLTGPVTDRLSRYFNTSVFSMNAPFTFGNAPRLMPNLRGPGENNFDISVFKNTRIREKYDLQFRAEAFNAFNRVQFEMPNTGIAGTSFGPRERPAETLRGKSNWRFDCAF